MLKVENKIKRPIPIQIEYIGTVTQGFIDDRANPVMDVSVVEGYGP